MTTVWANGEGATHEPLPTFDWKGAAAVEEPRARPQWLAPS
eukprot:CAMPEP_0197915344 /NCGR_PEP_ID=MMETSP1439-20131203/80038_1 /TAXON_ID=66791 /ORGANISM="Gonyaulax spinifera, Strain CCMP409" /LENGTH=40 /DNA_ID= /DNA_START= /DNA_END= /DNA_ORIENTATION=